jgi:16S rRNA (cytidine1402-2'-O)-methyltransferase
VFEGFLPSKRTTRRKRLEELRSEKRTLVFYEAPHRIVDAVEDMAGIFGDRRAVITRELTKVHEEIVRGGLVEILAHLNKGPSKGEFTIIIHGDVGAETTSSINPAEYLKNLMLHRGLSRKEAVAVAAADLGLPKKEVYKESLKI